MYKKYHAHLPTLLLNHCVTQVAHVHRHRESNKKPSCCCDSRSYCVRRILANYQTSFGYKFTNGWYARSDSTGRVYERDDWQWQCDIPKFSSSQSQ